MFTALWFRLLFPENKTRHSVESKAIRKHLKFIKYFSTAYSSTSLIAAAAATKAFQLLLKGEVAYAKLTGKKDPCDIHLWRGPTHEYLCGFSPQPLLIDTGYGTNGRTPIVFKKYDFTFDFLHYITAELHCRNESCEFFSSLLQ